MILLHFFTKCEDPYHRNVSISSGGNGGKCILRYVVAKKSRDFNLYKDINICLYH